MLDMNAKRWTTIQRDELRSVQHSLTMVSEKQILLVGGRDSNKVRLFDLDSRTWKEEKSLPENMAGQCSVLVRTRNGVSVICVGGSEPFWHQRLAMFNFEF